ncbi:MAG: nucleotide exchange factor GrpE [Acetobacteraceae bacterium]
MSNDPATATPEPASAAPVEEAEPVRAVPDSPEALMRAASERIAALEAERDQFRDRWMRAEAEMENLRARTRREVDDARLYAIQNFARDAVEAAENLRRGIASLPPAAPDEPAALARLREGFEGVERSFIATLERHGIRRADPHGQPFDPHLHQAMGEQESAEHPPGTVVQAWTQSWSLNGRLLKPAMVVIAKAPAEPDTRAHLDETA